MLNRQFISKSCTISLSYNLDSEVDCTSLTEQRIKELLNHSSLLKASDNFYEHFEYLTPSVMLDSSLRSLVDYLDDFCRLTDGKNLETILVSLIESCISGDGVESQVVSLQARPYEIRVLGQFGAKSLKGIDVLITRMPTGFSSHIDILQLSKDVLAQNSDVFFDAMSSFLSSVLSVDMVLAASIKNSHFTVVSGGGTLSPGVQLPLRDTPFLSLDKPCYLKSGAAEVYSKCLWLTQHNINSLYSVPLMNDEGEYVGVIALLNSNPIFEKEFASTLISVFSARATAEIEKRQAAIETNARHLRYQDLIEKSQYGVFVLSVDPPMSLSLSNQQQAEYLKDHLFFIEGNSAFLQQQNLIDSVSLIDLPLAQLLSQSEVDFIVQEFIDQGYCVEGKLVKKNEGATTPRYYSMTYNAQVQQQYLTHIYGFSHDVSDRIQHTRELAYQASHDELTHLLNRRFFKEEFEQVISVADSNDLLALLILDLDGFKEVNDTLGHVTGDELLQLVGPRLQECLQAHEVLLSRLGGDEFGIMVQDAATEDDLIDIAIKLVRAISTPFNVSGLDLRIGGSIGISCYPEHGNDFSSLMRCADVAMYQAKKLSRDFEIYQPADDYYSVRRLSLMMEIRTAVEQGQLDLYYQPITQISDSSIKGFEALVRWHHPELGLIPPGEFIPLIEVTDVIEPLTWWVVETAIKQLKQWQLQGRHYTVSVSVSKRNISEDSFVYRLSQLLRRYNVDGRLLELEITESTLMADPNKGRSVLNAISAMGVRFAIDDFGTGYSSLAYLKSLPINTLKIDKTFIAQMLDDEQDQIIVRSTIQLAHNLGMNVTAEGIESGLLIDELNDLGCEYAQGFFICKPLPIAELELWIEEYRQGRHPILSIG